MFVVLQAIVYIHGCDMLVGSSLDSFIHEGLKRLRSPDAPMVVLASQQPTGAQHAGSPTTAKEAERAMGGPGHVWMVHRRASAQFLAAWSDLVGAHTHTRTYTHTAPQSFYGLLCQRR